MLYDPTLPELLRFIGSLYEYDEHVNGNGKPFLSK